MTPGMLDGMHSGPTKSHVPWFIGAVAVVAVALIVCLTVLSALGADSTEVSRLLNTALNFIGPIVSGGAYLRASQAAEASRQTVTQTNGDLDRRIEAALEKALRRQDQRTVSRETELPPNDRPTL